MKPLKGNISKQTHYFDFLNFKYIWLKEHTLQYGFVSFVLHGISTSNTGNCGCNKCNKFYICQSHNVFVVQ